MPLPERDRHPGCTEPVDALIAPWLEWHAAGIFRLTGSDTLADRRLIAELHRRGWLDDAEARFIGAYLARERARRAAGGDPARPALPAVEPPTPGTKAFVEVFRASSRLEAELGALADEGQQGGHRPDGWYEGYIKDVVDGFAARLLGKIRWWVSVFGSPVVSAVAQFAVENGEKFGDRPCPDCINPCWPGPCW